MRRRCTVRINGVEHKGWVNEPMAAPMWNRYRPTRIYGEEQRMYEATLELIQKRINKLEGNKKWVGKNLKGLQADSLLDKFDKEISELLHAKQVLKTNDTVNLKLLADYQTLANEVRRCVNYCNNSLIAVNNELVKLKTPMAQEPYSACVNPDYQRK